MKKLGLLFAATAIIVLVGCKNEKKDMEKVNESIEMEVDENQDSMKAEAKSVSVTLESKSGSAVQGEAYFTEENGVVTLEAKFSGLKPGTHAIHLHEKADCSSEDAKSSGGHWNPTHAKHGKWGDAEGYHKGDIGNFEVGEDGTGRVSMKTDEWCIGCGDVNKDILGKAVIVHEGTDDFTTQPTGDAGGRVACGGVIE